MKKLLFSLVVMALVAPAMAVVDFDITDGGNGEATITMNTNGAVVRGVALVVTCTGGAKLVDLTSTVNAEFNTYVDYFALNGVGEVVGDTPDQEGHPYSLTGRQPVLQRLMTRHSVSAWVFWMRTGPKLDIHLLRRKI